MNGYWRRKRLLFWDKFKRGLDLGRLMRLHRSAFARPANAVGVQRLGRTISALVLRDGAIVEVGPNIRRRWPNG